MKVQIGLSLVALLTLLPVSAQADPLELHKGDHISIIGNTLADRMQHDGWLETMLQSRFPGRGVGQSLLYDGVLGGRNAHLRKLLGHAES